jgi:endonuclease/exonuclease/phosphatase (EEP) superfamily protein YafD
MSDHRFEQRGLLHAELKVGRRKVHVIVLHLGLIAGSRGRQVEQMLRFIEREIPSTAPVIVAGDFNDWGSKLRPAAQQSRFPGLPRRAGADLSLAPAPDAAGLRVLPRPEARGPGDPPGPNLVAHVRPPAADRRVQGVGMG